MKLKTKVIISFFITIFVPIILCGITFYLFSEYKVKAIGEQYGIENPTYEMLSNNALMLDILTSREYTELSGKVENHPRELENTSYLEKINAKLLKDSSFLAVRKDDEIFFNGSDRVEDHELLETLPAYGNTGIEENGGIYLHSDQKELVKQLDFTFEDGSDGSVFIVTKVDQIFPQMRKMWEEMFFATVLILVFTSFALSFWIYRGVISPLEQLKKATQNIKEGNLDFTVEGSSVKEINDLCDDFEEMRIRLKENAEEKVEFDKENKELISNISHDLKTPLTAIKGYSEAIMDGVADTPEKMERYIKTIYNKANDMDVLLNELSIASKIDCNTVPYNFTKIDIEAYFEDCMDEIGSDLEQRNMDFAFFNYCHNRCFVMADPEQLKRVITNIISNACKYSGKEKGHVNIRLKEMENYIQVEIEDDGIGISAKDLPNIFNRLYRADASRASSGGSGLGLSISKKIIEDHGGHIWASSKLNTGTTIYFTLNKVTEEDEEYE